MTITIKDLEGHLSPLGEDFKVSTLPHQMGYMLYSAEAFIAFPGGLETLHEIFTIAYWAKLHFHKKINKIVKC